MAAEHPETDGAEVAMLMYPNTPFVREPARYARVLDRTSAGELIVFNGILGRFIGANKLTLAVLSGPPFRALFDVDQLAGIEALVPWSRKGR